MAALVHGPPLCPSFPADGAATLSRSHRAVTRPLFSHSRTPSPPFIAVRFSTVVASLVAHLHTQHPSALHHHPPQSQRAATVENRTSPLSPVLPASQCGLRIRTEIRGGIRTADPSTIPHDEAGGRSGGQPSDTFSYPSTP